tara:strand:+ start:292 stop:690 length:399 start_codon:yes stop_codon:yes gene_type:complete
MDKKYPKHIIDYAIDNKVSLEEAYNHYILHGKQEKQRDEEELKPEKPKDFNIEDEEQFLSELEQKIKSQLSEDVMNDQEWWNKWHNKMDKISELENELNIQKRDDDEITKEEMEWVEWELGTVEKLIREGKI